MSGLQRIDSLNTPPVVGRFYLVPTVTAKWHNVLQEWPVIGPRHTDADFFNFEEEHYHIDGRFLNRRQWSVADVIWRSPEGEIQSAPLHSYRGEAELPKPVWRRRKCSRDFIPYEHGSQNAVLNLKSHYAGSQCERGKNGWVCPHRKAQLGSVPAIDGVITCPLHGLQISAETGKVLGGACP